MEDGGGHLEHRPEPAGLNVLDIDAVDWREIRHVTLVPFLADGRCALVPDGDAVRLPAGEVAPGEDPVLDTAFRVTMMQAGFRAQAFHPVAAAGDHVLAWAPGDPYAGSRPHARVHLWAGTSDEAATALRAGGDDGGANAVLAAAAARRALTDECFHRDRRYVLERAYLRAGTVEGGSGFGGDAEDWRAARSHIARAVDRSGTFLDVGCANGLLMESMVTWCGERGLEVHPHGVDISDALVAEARRRLPRWADRMWTGNAVEWRPPGGRRFDFVHTLVDLVPERRLVDMIRHHLDALVAPGGRLIVSSYSPFEDAYRHAAPTLTRLGLRVDGTTAAGGPRRDGRFTAPSAWIEVGR